MERKVRPVVTKESSTELSSPIFLVSPGWVDRGISGTANCPFILQPKGAHFVIKIIWLTQWPFSLLRWLTIPPFYHVSSSFSIENLGKGLTCLILQDNFWSVWHYLFASLSPLPVSILLLIAIKGWKGFSVTVSILPLPILLLLIGKPILQWTPKCRHLWELERVS